MAGVVWDGRELDWVDPCEVNDCCREFLRGVGGRFLTGRVFEEAFKRLLERYEPPRGRLMLILPCSYGKPYGQSFIHYHIQSVLVREGFYGRVHQVIVTNAGVVPRELEEYWPWCAYDWNPAYETREVKEEYVRVLASRLEKYIGRFRGYYTGFAAYLRWDSDSWRAVRLASSRLGIEIPNLAPRSVPGEEVWEVSLHGVYRDPDLVLITPSSLRGLADGLRRLLG
ncbi:MAG: hypothetical protein GXO09_02695 [Crenarchaeota archaeon]|nr:hypothetical protein [Thermoproteota archaeon]